MHPSRLVALAALLLPSCCDQAPPPQSVRVLDLPAVQGGERWRRFDAGGSYQATPISTPPIEHATSRADAYVKGGRRIEDTLEGPGFVVTQEYDEIGTVRQVLVEDPNSPLGVRIELDSNGTIRRIETLHMKRDTKAGLAAVAVDCSGWRFDLDERGRIRRSASGVTYGGNVVRSIE